MVQSHKTRLTRAGFVRAAAGAAIPLALGLRGGSALAAAPKVRGSLVLTSAELAQVRRNVFTLRVPFATTAWQQTLAKANNWLGYQPKPTRPDAVRPENWFETLYHPGLLDGSAAHMLAVAYAVGGRVDHGLRAKAICLAWARTYNPAPPQGSTGHLVAEPLGPVIKLCMAYELTKPLFTASERVDFGTWATQFVSRGQNGADRARDEPWVTDVTYGADRANPAPYGNSATWQRAMAVWSAAAAGTGALRSALDWNFQHRTPGGLEYGWDDLLEGLVIDGAGGEVIEGRYRSSIHYGHFSWAPLVHIADLARRARFRVDLFTYRTKKHGYTVFTPLAYYAPFVMSETVPPELEKTTYGGRTWPEDAARWRALYEVLYRNAKDPKLVDGLRRAVSYGGARRRGDNYDIYVVGHAALLGRGSKGPMPATGS